MSVKNILEKIRKYGIDRLELQNKISIVIAEILKNSKITRININRILDNINNVCNIFPNDFTIDEIEPYLHKETKDIIKRGLNWVISGDVPAEISRFSIKNNVVAHCFGIFIDYLIYRDYKDSLFRFSLE